MNELSLSSARVLIHTVHHFNSFTFIKGVLKSVNNDRILIIAINVATRRICTNYTDEFTCLQWCECRNVTRVLTLLQNVKVHHVVWKTTITRKHEHGLTSLQSTSFVAYHDTVTSSEISLSLELQIVSEEEYAFLNDIWYNEGVEKWAPS